MADGRQVETKSGWWVFALRCLAVSLRSQSRSQKPIGDFFHIAHTRPSGGVDSPFLGLVALAFDHRP